MALWLEVMFGILAAGAVIVVILLINKAWE